MILTYTVSATDDDATPLSDTETFTVTITGTNDALVITGGPDTSSLTETNTGLTDSGTPTWAFNSGGEAFDFLATGETLILTYTFSASDDDGTPLSDTTTVTVSITGTNDAPDITVAGGDSRQTTSRRPIQD